MNYVISVITVSCDSFFFFNPYLWSNKRSTELFLFLGNNESLNRKQFKSKVLRRQFDEQECGTEETPEVLLGHGSLSDISDLISLYTHWGFDPTHGFTTLFSQFSISSPPQPLCVQQRQQTWGRGDLWNAGSLTGSWPVCTPVISPVWSLCFPREASGLPPTPPSFFSETHTNTQRCILNVNVCESAGSQSQHWIGGYELLSPKITHKPGNTTHNFKSQWQISKTGWRHKLLGH